MNQTEIIRKRYNRSVRLFEFTEKMMEKGEMRNWRELIWKQAKGKVLEVGVGTGANIKYYPEGLDITAIDFSENMLLKAKERASILNKDVDLLQMDVQTLDFPDETFDTIVATCVFCSVPDPIKGLLELKRVCKNNGNILLLEHVRSSNKLVGFIMDLLNPLTVKLVGVNINRKTADNLTKAGLSIGLEHNFMFDIVKYFKCNL
ncbi:MAG: class I SAM-dependent methyltransferase [Burkholderiales bacterium]